MRAAQLGDDIRPIDFIILGPRPSNHVALDETSAVINVETLSGG